MSMYEKNLNYLKDSAPALYEVLTTQESQYPSEVTFLDSLNMEIKNGEISCFAHSLYDPHREVKKMFSAVRKDVEALFVFGMGLFLSKDYIIDTYKDLKSLTLIEPDLNVFKAALHHVDFSALVKSFPNISVIINETPETTLSTIWDLFQRDSAQKLDFAYSLPYRSLYPDYYEYVHREFRKILRDHMTNLVTQNLFLYQWVENALKNYRHEAVPLTEFVNKLEDVPAIIVSAGPSLNYNIDYLRQLDGKAVIIAVGSAIKILDSNNIVPHFRIAFDPSHFQKKSFDGIQTQAAPLIFSDALYPAILDEYKGPLLRMIVLNDRLSNFLGSKFDSEMFTVTSGFSIANVALDMAIKLGFQKIIFMGQDLCYTEDSVYASGSWRTAENKIDTIEAKNLIQTVNNLGEPVYTNKILLGMKNLMEGIIKSHPEVTFINCTEKGLEIEGAPNHSIANIFEKDFLSIADIRGVINGIIEGYSFKTSREDQFKALGLPQTIRDLLEINDLRFKQIKKLTKYSKKGLGDSKIKLEIDYIEKEFTQQLEAHEFYSAVIGPALEFKFYALEVKHNLHEKEQARALDSRIQFLFDASVVLKDYLEYFLHKLEE